MANLKQICIAGICSDVVNPDNYATKAEVNAKQDQLTPGANITISGNTISATDTTYTAGTGIDITNGVISSTIDSDVFVPVQTLPDASTADPNKIYLVPKTDGGVEEWHVVDDGGTPTWDKFGEEDIDLSNYYNKTETNALLDEKQDVLTAGNNISIENGVISATDTTYTAGSNISITNGEISADLSNYYNKAYIDALEDRIEALEALLAGKQDIVIAKTDYDDTTVSVTVLGEVTNE